MTNPSEVGLPQGGSFSIQISSIKADDRAGTISAEGTKDALDELGRVLAEFDLPRRKIVVHIEIHSKLDKYDTTADFQIASNAAIRFGDEVTGLALEIRPRKNGDGSIGANFDISLDRVHSYFPMRIERSSPVEFGVGEDGVTWRGHATLQPISIGLPLTPQPKHMGSVADFRVTVLFTEK